MLQEVERQQRTQLMETMRSLPVHMKSTFSSQIQATVVREVGLEHPIRKAEPKKRYYFSSQRSANPCSLTVLQHAMPLISASIRCEKLKLAYFGKTMMGCPAIGYSLPHMSLVPTTTCWTFWLAYGVVIAAPRHPASNIYPILPLAHMLTLNLSNLNTDDPRSKPLCLLSVQHVRILLQVDCCCTSCCTCQHQAATGEGEHE